MNYKSSDLGIIIASNNPKNIKICIKSIENQINKPHQTIIVFPRNNFFQNSKKIIFSNIKISNQVQQRTHALSLIDPKIKLILQLDDKFYLHKNTIKNLIKIWNSVDKTIAGIGIKSNLQDFDQFENFNFIKNILFNWHNKPGKILKNGLNNQFDSNNKLYEVDWLQGGLSSWRLEHVPHIFRRKFPNIKWSVFEDVIFSYDVKFNKKFQLLMCQKVKVSMIKKKLKKFSLKEYFYRGYEYARMHKVFVYINADKLSKISYFYFNLLSSLFGIIYCSITLNKKFFFYIGKMNGIFADIKKIRTL